SSRDAALFPKIPQGRQPRAVWGGCGRRRGLRESAAGKGAKLRMSMKMTRRKALGSMAGAVTLAMVPAAAEDRLADLYSDALVIDALSFGKKWGRAEFSALRDAGY